MTARRAAGGWWRGGRLLALAGLGLVLAAASHRLRPPTPRLHLIEIRGMAFAPPDLEAAPGDTVVWVNRDLVPHTATAARPPGWSTGILRQGAQGRWVAGERGEFRYRCELHPVMTARLVVR